MISSNVVPVQTLHFSSKNPLILIPGHTPSRKSKPSVVRARVAAPETLYEVLGVAEKGSTASDIKRAYKQMARKYHPDMSPPDRLHEHTRRFILVRQAYQTLSDPDARASYDRDCLICAVSAASRCQEMEGKNEWKSKWESQLDELKQRGGNRDSSGRMSWGARMRNQTRP